MILVYKYGLAAPHEHYDRILDQMRAAHRYRNTLVEIERHRRAAERALYAELGPQLAALTLAVEAAEKELQAALDEIRRVRAKTRKRSETEEMRQRLQIARDSKRQFALSLREARRQLRESPEIIAGRDRISELSLGMVRGARALSGLARSGPHFGAWGTYQLVEEAAQKSFADLPLYALDGVTPNDPRFCRWQGEGAVSVQIQGGASLQDSVSGDHPQLRLTLPDERAWLKMPGNGYCARKRLARLGQLALCLGTDAEGARLYGLWRLDMHRPLPDGAQIKRATVHRRASGPHGHWSLELTIECPEARRVLPERGGSVAIDIGWRQVDGQLRVAGWMDDTGASGELRLSEPVLRALREPEEIRSRRDSGFDMEILRLTRWLGAFEKLPDWLRQETLSVRQWKSPGRLASLRHKWADQRFAGDEIAFASLEAWATADRHYWEQESRRRDASLRRRRDLYRVFARQMCDQYETIVLEQFDLRVFAKRAEPLTVAENEVARSNRHLAALSELRQAIMDCASRSGRAVAQMPAHDTTRACPVCGLVEDRGAAASIRLACECGAAWDQDVTGAPTILLARWRERPGDAKMAGGARADAKDSDSEGKPEGRRDRVTRMRKEKVARMDAARKEGGMSAE